MNVIDFIEKHKYGIIGTVFLHMILFIYLTSEVVEFGKYEPKEKVIMEIDFSEENPEEQVDFENDDSQTSDAQEQDVSNVAANANQEQTTYTNANSFSKSQADQEVWNELMALEANEYGKINANKAANSSDNGNGDNESENPTVNPNLVKQDAKENKNASFGSSIRATATYSVKGRTMQLQGIPAYKCQTEGIVRINIKVNQKGEVIGREIDESKTNTQNDCLRSEALEYAKKWHFTQNFDDPIRVPGWIEFKYVAQ